MEAPPRGNAPAIWPAHGPVRASRRRRPGPVKGGCEPGRWRAAWATGGRWRAAWATGGRWRAAWATGGRWRAAWGHWRAGAGRQRDIVVHVGRAPISVTAAAGSRLPDSGAQAIRTRGELAGRRSRPGDREKR